MARRVSTKSLVENEAFADRRRGFVSARGINLARGVNLARRSTMRMVYNSMEHPEEFSIEEMRADLHSFYAYYQEIKGTPAGDRIYRNSDIKAMYRKLTEIVQKYPSDNTLRNKFDEIERRFSRLMGERKYGRHQ